MKNILKNVLVKGVVTTVPEKISRVTDYENMSETEAKKFSQVTGILERRIVNSDQTSSDLCVDAAKRLLEITQWGRDEIEIVVMITQSADYPIPATAIIIQDRLGLSRNTLAFDINLGCSSYPYGLAVIGSTMRSLGLKKGLLLIGDTSSKLCSYTDKSTWPLFGDAGSATAIEVDESADTQIVFDFHSDGAGKDAIIINSGGLASRNPFDSTDMSIVEISPGINRSAQHLQLKGADVFSFAIKEVPASINNCLNSAGMSLDNLDYVILHQANKMINDMIAKKIKCPIEKMLSSLELFGNTSSVSIPLTMCVNSEKINSDNNLLLSGFGVGLSWASCLLPIVGKVPMELVEVASES
jgi:3-oxoacyl-[acyl-carrier-protein] synthase-3